MFFVLLFLILAASAAHFFPEWSTVTVLLAAFGSVAVLRIAIGLFGRREPAGDKQP